MALNRMGGGGADGGLSPSAREEIRLRLDDPSAAARLDPYGMLRLIEGLPAQVTEGYHLGRQAVTAHPVDPSGIRNVVVAGMGGSAIGGDLLRALAADHARVPVEVVRDYRLPAYVDDHTLVLASSYSGNTEETLAAQEEAARRGATVVALTSGGHLGDAAGRAGWPLVRMPPGIPPRAALGYSLFGAIGALEQLGLLPSSEATVLAARRALEALQARCGVRVPFASNPAKQEALELTDRIPIVYGSSGVAGPVAYRWKCQFNENSKHPAYWTVLPELDHNEIVGWEAPPLAARQLRVLFLRTGDEGDRMRRRLEATRRIIEGRVGGSLVEFSGEGDGHFARGMWLLHLGDYLSFYLAIAKGIDPSPVRFIDRLKAELATMH